MTDLPLSADELSVACDQMARGVITAAMRE
jgi:hypothetical protein